MKNYIFLFFSLLALVSEAQNNYCPTRLSDSQILELKDFQQKLEKGEVSLGKKALQYVPFKAIIVGNDNGIGYYSVSMLMQTICELNERFIPLGFHFYIADSITYVNNVELYQGNSDAIWSVAPMYKLDGAVNVFFHGESMQWCGVYFGGVDLIFIQNYCQQTNSTTLTHELGHFFGLPHTFLGWENGAIPAEIEKINGSNCRTAGDGFCDTKPDYVSKRWNCPLGWNLTDPNNVVFKPDSSLYMNYAMDECHQRFSNEQILTMQNNLASRQIFANSVDVRSLPAPQKISPLPGDSNLNAKYVHLKWNAVPGAFAYLVQVARFGNWNYLNYDKLVFDTAVTCSLFGDWSYAWRVKTITAGNTCAAFSSTDTFSTHELPEGVHELFLEEVGNIYPNPLKAGERLLVKANSAAEIILYNSFGQPIQPRIIYTGNQYEINISDPGFYFLEIKCGDSFLCKRIIVQ